MADFFADLAATESEIRDVVSNVPETPFRSSSRRQEIDSLLLAELELGPDEADQFETAERLGFLVGLFSVQGQLGSDRRLPRLLVEFLDERRGRLGEVVGSEEGEDEEVGLCSRIAR